jgi:hypothetical protein
MHTHLLFFPAVSSYFLLPLGESRDDDGPGLLIGDQGVEQRGSLEPAREARAPGTMAIQQHP